MSKSHAASHIAWMPPLWLQAALHAEITALQAAAAAQTATERRAKTAEAALDEVR